MKKNDEIEYYDKIKNWNFDSFQIETEKLTNWDLIQILKKVTNKNSKILDLGTGCGEKLLRFFPACEEILGTDLSPFMIETANKNLKKSGRNNISFKVMDNLNMDVPKNYFDVVVARNTVTDPKQIYECLKEGGYLLIRGVDKYDCHSLKMIFGRGQSFDDKIPISIVDYEAVIEACFKDVELVPIFERELFKNKELFRNFLMKVPILENFNSSRSINEDLLDKYILHNTYNGKIKLLRRYYGIIGRK